jgi:DNA-binding NarL/FixJ family response regulator
MTTDDKQTKTIRLLIVDDHQMVRDGIRVMLESQQGFYQYHITEADNGEEAVTRVLRGNFDAIIVDYQMPGISGAETVRRMVLYKPDVKVLALSNYDELSYISDMLMAGAKGYVLKNIEPVQLVHAIQTIISNMPYYSNEVAVKLLDAERNHLVRTGTPASYGLTKREIEILRMIALELTNDEIAETLSIAKRTVDSHRQNLLHKLQVKNTVGLIKAAYEFKLIKQ